MRKIGDKFKVIGNYGNFHHFEIGDEVVLLDDEIDEEGCCQYKNESNSLHQWLRDTDVELISDTPLINSDPTVEQLKETLKRALHMLDMEQRQTNLERSKRIKKQATIQNLNDRVTAQNNLIHELQQENLILNQQVEGLKKQIR